jgi:predicted nucleic acid-binding protein
MRGTLDRGARLLTADLAYAEVANALWRACTLRGLIDEKAVYESLDSLYRLPVEPMRHESGLVKRAVEISLKSGLSVYDSIYVSMAEREKAAVFTLDEKQRSVAQKYVHAYMV